MPIGSFAAAAGFVLVSIVDPTAGAYASPAYVQAPTPDPQTLDIAGGYDNVTALGEYGITDPPEPEPIPVPEVAEADSSSGSGGSSSAPAAGVPDPGSAKAIAYDMVVARGWGTEQYDCLVSLWNKESGWNVYAHNKSSGAYGIPQSLPGKKMASVAADWQTNPATQITWGLDYIEGRYGAPCGAWSHSKAVNWY